jgi:hypothetical protein
VSATSPAGSTSPRRQLKVAKTTIAWRANFARPPRRNAILSCAPPYGMNTKSI